MNTTEPTKTTNCIDCPRTFTFVGRCRKRCEPCAVANKAKLREAYNRGARDLSASFNSGEALGTNNRSLFHRLSKLTLCSHADVAKSFGISDRAVRVIELKLLAKLRSRLDPARRARGGEADKLPKLKTDGKDTRWSDEIQATAPQPIQASSKRGTLFRKVRARIRAKWAIPSLYPEVRAARRNVTPIDAKVNGYLAELAQRPAPLECLASSEEYDESVKELLLSVERPE